MTSLSDIVKVAVDELTAAGLHVDTTEKGKAYGLHGVVWVLSSSGETVSPGVVLDVVGAVTVAGGIDILTDKIWIALIEGSYSPTGWSIARNTSPLGREGQPPADVVTIEVNTLRYLGG